MSRPGSLALASRLVRIAIFLAALESSHGLGADTFALVISRGSSPAYPWICNLDGSGAQQLATLPLGTRPRLENGLVALCSENPAGEGAGIYTMAPVPGSPVTRVPGSEVVRNGWNDVDISPDGTRIAYSGAQTGDSYQNHNIYVQGIDGSGQTLIRRDTSYHFTAIDWAEPSRILFIRSDVGNAYTQYPHGISPDGTGLQQFNSDFTQYPASRGPSGAIVASQGWGGAEHLVVFDSSFQNPVPIPNASRLAHPTWHPTENAVFAVNLDTRDVYKIDVTTGLQTRITNFGDVNTVDCGSKLASGADPGRTSTLTLVGGTVAGQAVSPQSRSVTVAPGQALTGELQVRIDSSFGSNAVMAMGVTPTWGTHSTSYRDLGGFVTPVSGLVRTVPIDFTAPMQAGTYHVITAYRGEFTAEQVMSGTNWSAGNVVWDDGNDVAGWTAVAISAANASGNVIGSVRFADGFRPLYVPATGIQVVVQSPTGGSVLTAGSGTLCNGGSVTVPITLTGSVKPVSVQFDVTFDPSKVNVTAVEAGSLTQGFSISSNVTQGRVRVAMASGAPAASESGEAARITFSGLAGLVRGDVVALDVENVSVNDISGTGAPGTLTCPACRRGDVNGNGVVSAYDASLVLQAVVGAITLDSTQTCAADFNENGAVTAYDASLILQCVVQGTCP